MKIRCCALNWNTKKTRGILIVIFLVLYTWYLSLIMLSLASKMFNVSYDTKFFLDAACAL